MPQRSVLGPTLFIIFVNDMPNVINSILLMFADDTKLYRTIDSPQDHNILQHDTDQLCVWDDRSPMSFNLDKCHVMSFGRTREVYNYTMKKAAISLPMNRCEQECDLGVLFTPDLKFSQHIKLITHKANSVIGIIKRSFSCLDQNMFRTLYISLVRPHLEYASEIWNLYLMGDIQTLVKVQRWATKLVPGLRDLDYTNRPIALNLPSLLYRRQRMDMITVFRIVHGLQGVPFENLFQFHNTITRGN